MCENKGLHDKFETIYQKLEQNYILPKRLLTFRHAFQRRI